MQKCQFAMSVDPTGKCTLQCSGCNRLKGDRSRFYPAPLLLKTHPEDGTLSYFLRTVFCDETCNSTPQTISSSFFFVNIPNIYLFIIHIRAIV